MLTLFKIVFGLLLFGVIGALALFHWLFREEEKRAQDYRNLEERENPTNYKL